MSVLEKLRSIIRDTKPDEYRFKGIRWIHGKSESVLKWLPDSSIDSCITDPPYELDFMGKKWDSSGIAFSVDLWKEVLRVMKPGSYLLAFGGDRTHHRMACAIEDAGFEIVTEMLWLYGQGMPKGLNISKSIDKMFGEESKIIGSAGSSNVYLREPVTELAKKFKGFHSALKPAFEPITVAIKPFEGTYAENAARVGVAGFNVDPCRVGTKVMVEGRATPSGSGVYSLNNNKEERPGVSNPEKHEGRFPSTVIIDKEAAEVLDAQGGYTKSQILPVDPRVKDRDGTALHMNTGSNHWLDGLPGGFEDEGGVSRYFKIIDGRFPSTVLIDEEAGALIDEQSGYSKSTRGERREAESKNEIKIQNSDKAQVNHEYSDEGGASRFFNRIKSQARNRFFYCPKAKGGEKNAGAFAEEELKLGGGLNSTVHGDSRTGNKTYQKNNHATVKPLELMRYLCKLTRPPHGGVVLDPFGGSGTTGIAAALEGREFIGIEMEKSHFEIGKCRFSGILSKVKDDNRSSSKLEQTRQSEQDS